MQQTKLNTPDGTPMVSSRQVCYLKNLESLFVHKPSKSNGTDTPIEMFY